MTLDTATLATLLHDAADAHHIYESSLGHADPQWWNWYAEFIAAKLPTGQGSASCPTCGQTTLQPAFPIIGAWKPLPSSVPLDAPTETDIAAYGLSAYGVTAGGK